MRVVALPTCNNMAIHNFYAAAVNGGSRRLFRPPPPRPSNSTTSIERCGIGRRGRRSNFRRPFRPRLPVSLPIVPFRPINHFFYERSYNRRTFTNTKI